MSTQTLPFHKGTVPPGTFRSDDPVEKKKDELDLVPTLAFVQNHLPVYERSLRRFMHRPRTIDYPAARPHLVNSDHMSPLSPQLTAGDVMSVVSRLPKVILEISMLEKVDYIQADIVPVPVFKKDGSWRDVDFVDVREFPRKKDHPSRILIGRSTGKEIYPSALPDSIHEGKRARWFYQLHVFFHEMFHTVELLRRNEEEGSKLIFRNSDGEFSFRKWVTLWDFLFLPERICQYPSRYASNYAPDLSLEKRQLDGNAYDRALAEQMCESFVGYILGIVPNDDDCPVFKEHSPDLWSLMDMLATSTIVKK